jgi:hypothetical protein
MRTFPLSVSGIDARLKELEEERKALLALRHVYEGDSDLRPDPRKTAKKKHPAAVVLKPTESTATPQHVPGSPLVIPTGASEAIRQTVAAQPGIELSKLISVVLEKVPPTHQQNPRKNIANIIAQQVKRKKLVRNADGQFFVAQEGLQGM